ATQKLLSGALLEDISKEMKTELALGNPLEQGTGVMVETEDGHLKFDNTLETRLNRLQGGLRSSVYRILMGE
ncbi:MAG TPA: V-type ATP synthase subunit E, partial [Candidatus Methylomirabilis sp.]|nr:V-type ATP synthase subunit E [Candidatus Methylomirabilis sp.]